MATRRSTRAVATRDRAPVGLLLELEQEWLAGVHDGPIVGATSQRHSNADHDRFGGDLHDRCGGDVVDRCGGNVHGLHLWKLGGYLPPIVLG